MFASRVVIGCLPAVVLMVAGCGGGGGDASVPSDQQALAEEIKTLGGMYFVEKTAPEKGIYSVDLSGTKADDAMVAKLTAIPELRHLKLSGTPVTNAALASLKKMANLATLDLGNSKVTAEGLRSLLEEKPTLEVVFNLPPTPTGENLPVE
jgi:hypothetical protein